MSRGGGDAVRERREAWGEETCGGRVLALVAAVGGVGWGEEGSPPSPQSEGEGEEEVGEQVLEEVQIVWIGGEEVEEADRRVEEEGVEGEE